MSSAIEVLKKWQDKLDSPDILDKELSDVLGEAIIALEQKEEWLSDIQMLKAENKELQAKLNACESRCINLEGELNEL